MLIDELIDNLRGQVDPDVKDSIFGLILEGLEQVLLDVAHDGVSATKIELVPMTVGLSITDTLLTNRSVSEQMIDKFDREHLNLVIFLEAADIYMVALRNVQENTINEEEERFNVKELAPTETEIKEKLSQPLVVDTLSIQLFDLAPLAKCLQLPTLLQPRLFFRIHEPLVFLIKLLTALVTFRLFVCLFVDLLQVATQFVRLLLFLLLSLQVNLPILFCRFSCGRLIEVQYETLLNLHIKVDILMFGELFIILLLHEDEPL